jgi:putative SOS response-associated peptidase YedK
MAIAGKAWSSIRYLVSPSRQAGWTVNLQRGRPDHLHNSARHARSIARCRRGGCTLELPISWNVAPPKPVYAVATGSSGTRKLRALRWGLVPSWAKNPSIGARLINTRSETPALRPLFGPLVSIRRALLPVSGFYEPRRSGLHGSGPAQ